MKDLVVIGGGIIGTTVTKYLRLQKLDVELIDACFPNSGTTPSGGHMRWEWCGKMPKKEYETSVTLMDNLWGVQSLKCAYGATGEVTIERVNVDKILRSEKYIRGEVRAVYSEDGIQRITYFDFSKNLVYEIETRNVLVSTGHWLPHLLKGVSVQAKAGVSFRVPGQLQTPYVFPWAPYKQIVANQHDDKDVWIGDGTSVLHHNWKSDRTKKCQVRCLGSLKERAKLKGISPKVLYGIRPYCAHSPDKPLLFKQIKEGYWIATGAAKCGTIAAGWTASKLLSSLE